MRQIFVLLNASQIQLLGHHYLIFSFLFLSARFSRIFYAKYYSVYGGIVYVVYFVLYVEEENIMELIPFALLYVKNT